MSVCLRHVEAFVHNRFFFTNFAFVWSKGQTYPVIDSPVHGKHDGETFSSVPQSVGKLQPFL